MDIGSFVEEYLRSRGISLTELSRLLGYGSKTSIVRLVKNEANLRSVEHFAACLRENGGLSVEEQRRLDEVIEALRWQENYESAKEMFVFLKGRTNSDRSVVLQDVFKGVECLFEERYNAAEALRFTILNCAEVPVFVQLGRLIEEKDAVVEHFMQTDGNNARTISTLSTLLPIVYSQNYSGYINRLSKKTTHRGVWGSDMLHVSYVSEGVHREDLIVFSEPCRGSLITAETADCLERMIEIDRKEYVPVKREFSLSQFENDYAQFSRECALLERDRSVLSIRPDFDIAFVPTEILVSAAMDGMYPEEDRCDPSFMELIGIYEERYRNNREKKKHSRYVLTRSGMWNFVRTGKMSDHFWGMRPFTVEERVRILEDLLARMEENPYFHLYIMKEEIFGSIMIYLYEGKGILRADPESDYDLSKHHSEILVVHPEILRVFRTYFMEKILVNYVMPEGSERAFLKELLAYLRENPDETGN